jgi:hypothetical protein
MSHEEYEEEEKIIGNKIKPLKNSRWDISTIHGFPVE